MPQEQKKKASPSKGLLNRLFGSEELSPQVQEAIKIARSENPNLAPIEPYGLLSKLLQPNAQAYASPGRTIYINPSQMEGQTPQDIADTLIHEQTHVNQMNERGLGPTRELLHEAFGGNGLPYHQRPDEMAAYQNEKLRRAKMGRMQTAIPSFETGKFYVPADINLVPEKKR